MPANPLIPLIGLKLQGDLEFLDRSLMMAARPATRKPASAHRRLDLREGWTLSFIGSSIKPWPASFVKKME